VEEFATPDGIEESATCTINYLKTTSAPDDRLTARCLDARAVARGEGAAADVAGRYPEDRDAWRNQED